ncbi:hypothetical protein ADUPG1_003252, partial [Aduncisulcus paluster]
MHDEKFPVMKPEEEVRKGKRYVDGIARSAEAWKRIREGCAREDDWECVNIREEDETKIKQLMGEVKKSPEGRTGHWGWQPRRHGHEADGGEEADLLGDVEFNAFIRASGKELVDGMESLARKAETVSEEDVTKYAG